MILFASLKVPSLALYFTKFERCSFDKKNVYRSFAEVNFVKKF